MASVDQQISGYEAALDHLDQSGDGERPSAAFQTLVARDRVAVALTDENSSVSHAAIQQLEKNDRRLTNLAVKLDSTVGRDTLKNWRRSRSPDEKSWWWSLDDLAIAKLPWRRRLLTVLAVIFLTVSVGIAADTFNLLRSVGENPIGTIGYLTQAVLAFIAASAFTPAGRKWLIDFVDQLGFKGRKFQGGARMLLAFIVLVVTILIRAWLPALAAGYFQRQGDRFLTEGLVQRAIPAYQEAAVLQPYWIPTHAGLARASERAGEYGKAIAEYKSTLTLYERGGQALDDSYYEAKNNLARLLILHEKNYPGALRLLDKPEEMIAVSPQNRKLYTYYFWTYRGWANLELKYYGQAEGDLWAALQQRDAAVARYLMGRVFEGVKKTKEAKAQWSLFSTILQQDPKQIEEVQPDWISYAQERTLGKGEQ